jgi:hypothetical protein
VKNSVCNESGIVPLQAFAVAILNIPVLTEDIFIPFFCGGEVVSEITLLHVSICTHVYLLLLNHLIYFQKKLYELYTVRQPQHSMTYFSTMSKNNGKSALQGGSNTNITKGPEMIKIDVQKICNFCRSHIFAGIQ